MIIGVRGPSRKTYHQWRRCESASSSYIDTFVKNVNVYRVGTYIVWPIYSTIWIHVHCTCTCTYVVDYHMCSWHQKQSSETTFVALWFFFSSSYQSVSPHTTSFSTKVSRLIIQSLPVPLIGKLPLYPTAIFSSMRLISPREKYVLVVWIASIHLLRAPIKLWVGFGLGVLVHMLYNNHILWCPVIFAPSLVKLTKRLFPYYR